MDHWTKFVQIHMAEIYKSILIMIKICKAILSSLGVFIAQIHWIITFYVFSYFGGLVTMLYR